MEGVRGVPALDARIQGVKDALEGTGVEVVIGGAETKCDSAQGATVAEDLLTRAPDLTAIYSACDDPGDRRRQGRQGPGQGRLVVGYDGLPGAAQAILDGDMKATIAQFPGQMATLGVQAAVDAGPRRRGRTLHRHRHGTRHRRQRRPVPPIPVIPQPAGRPSVLVVTSRRRRRSHQEDSCACRPPVSHVCSTSSSRPTGRANRPGGAERGHDRRSRRRRRAVPDVAWSHDGSDAMNPDPDYSAAYVTLRTDDSGADGSGDGYGLVFTIGRGNEVAVAAIEALAAHVVGSPVPDSPALLADLSRRLVGDSQLRWLGPEKGVMHMAIGAVVNAAWDLASRRARVCRCGSTSLH